MLFLTNGKLMKEELYIYWNEVKIYWKGTSLRGGVRIRGIKWYLFLFMLLFIGGCSGNEPTYYGDIKYFPTQEGAIEHFVEVREVTGSIDAVTTTKNEVLLVSQSSGDTYFVGELKEITKGFYAVTLSASVVVGVGAAWELTSMDNHKYTIFFEKDNETAHSIRLTNQEYYISLVEGHTLRENMSTGTNAIKELQNIKSYEMK